MEKTERGSIKMTEKKIELNEEQLLKVSGGCEDHDPDYYAATPPCVRCGYKYMVIGKSCPCCGASEEEQLGG